MRPILFHLGKVPIYSYGFMLFIAFLTGTLLGRRELKQRGVDVSNLFLFVAVAAMAAIVGSRLFYVLGHLNEFSSNWSRIFDINSVGLVYYGGLLLAIPVGVLTARWLKLPLGPLADAAGLVLPLCIAIARIGCFLNGCCGGKPSGLPWAVTFPGAAEAVHPTQLYEMVLDLVAFAILLGVRKRLKRDWDLFLLSLALYASIRFTVEFFRFHPSKGGSLFFQALSALIFGVTVGIMLYRQRTSRAGIAVGGRGSTMEDLSREQDNKISKRSE